MPAHRRPNPDRTAQRLRPPRVRVAAAAALAALAATTAATAAGAPAQADTAPYTVQTLHFLVHVGPDRSQACDIIGDMYVPNGASAAHPVPSILTTNGFGGSKDGQTPFAQTYASDGYAVLSYSGLGFGASGCKITLDDPDYDGVAASQLVDYLGGKPGIAFTDAAHTQPAPAMTAVVHDATDHDGVAHQYDPRVGMWGGSYGGQIQFAVAGIDHRVDAINPQITWNDLSYSLDPNNADAATTPGAVKTTWAALFSTVGILDGVQYAQQDPSRLFGCPNFATFVCPALASGGATGYLQPGDVASLRHASVANYLSRIVVPTLLDQGEVDTLFNLNEAVTTYRALKAQGTPVAMIWRYNGHSGGTPSAAGAAYEAARIKAWFDHYLKGLPVATGPAFAYYRDWDGSTAEAASYPVGSRRTYYLSGNHTLVTSPVAITHGSQAMTTVAGGAPTTINDPDALGGQAGVSLDVPDANTPGTYVYWDSAPLAAKADVVGSPKVTVSVIAPSAIPTSTQGPAGQVVLFAKIYDVAPGAAPKLINSLVAPIRIADPRQAVHITLPAFAHRFLPGHRIRLMVAGGDPNYRGGVTATPVGVTTGSATQTLTLPVVG